MGKDLSWQEKKWSDAANRIHQDNMDNMLTTCTVCGAEIKRKNINKHADWHTSWVKKVAKHTEKSPYDLNSFKK